MYKYSINFNLQINIEYIYIYIYKDLLYENSILKKIKNFCWSKIFINFGIYKSFWSKISGYFIIKNFE